LPRVAKHFSAQLAKDAHAAGLAVTLADGKTRAIPVTASPVILEDAEIEQRAKTSRLLASATFKMAKAALAGWMREDLLASMSPLERSLAVATGAKVSHLATVRVDYFVSDRPWALEINATIPAMQAYSDIAAEQFLRAVGRQAGASAETISEWIVQNGSNTRSLFDALMATYALERGKDARPRRMVLLSRPQDAQLTEQRHLARRFTEFGVASSTAHPTDLTISRGAVSLRGEPVDLIYRHLFVRRLEEMDAAPLKQLYADAPTGKVSLINAPASHVEVKGVFAELSRALTEPELATEAGLTPEELTEVRASVPWTRRFLPGPATLSDGSRIPDLIAHVASEPARYVLKRSWDYGGKQVFLGGTVGEPVFDERVEAAYGSALTWDALCQKASVDPAGGGFVVQEVVLTQAEPHLLCTPTELKPVDLFVDYSGYASVGGASGVHWGGVCRGSVSRIVNIVGGGGVIPLLRRPVADALMKALETSGGI
jgi:hypothetical protein